MTFDDPRHGFLLRLTKPGKRAARRIPRLPAAGSERGEDPEHERLVLEIPAEVELLESFQVAEEGFTAHGEDLVPRRCDLRIQERVAADVAVIEPSVPEPLRAPVPV